MQLWISSMGPCPFRWGTNPQLVHCERHCSCVYSSSSIFCFFSDLSWLSWLRRRVSLGIFFVFLCPLFISDNVRVLSLFILIFNRFFGFQAASFSSTNTTLNIRTSTTNATQTLFHEYLFLFFFFLIFLMYFVDRKTFEFSWSTSALLQSLLDWQVIGPNIRNAVGRCGCFVRRFHSSCRSEIHLASTFS